MAVLREGRGLVLRFSFPPLPSLLIVETNKVLSLKQSIMLGRMCYISAKSAALAVSGAP